MSSQYHLSPYHLYGIANAGSVIIEYLLEKGGIPYTASYPTKVERDEVSYRAHSPRGQVPVLITPEGDGISESLGIIIYLLDRHPGIGLLPEKGDPARGKTLQWLSFLAVNLYTANQRCYQSYTFSGDHKEIKRGGFGDRCAIYGELDAIVAPYCCGETLSAADLYLYMFLKWDKRLDDVLATHPNLSALHEAVSALDYVDAVHKRQPSKR